MSSSSHGSDECKFEHTFIHSGKHKGGVSGDAKEAVKKIRKGEISSYEQLQDEGHSIKDIMGGHVRKLKAKAGSQGTGYGAILSAADKLDTEMGYTAERVKEAIFVSPQSQLHDEFMQRKQQAEQRLNQAMGSFSDRMEQKHLLEHDIRKLRSRAEAFNAQDEEVLKGDFVELVDGAGGQQGAPQGSLDFLRNNNIYPTIVADFMEMDSVDDLKKAEDREDDQDGALADLPRNEKAILRKKYTMYEKWKDMYGSEVNRRLKELKAQLENLEQSIQNIRDWLEPYVRDVVMINEMGDLQDRTTVHHQWKGYASMKRELEFIVYKGFSRNSENRLVEDSDSPTHYRVMHIHGMHVVQAQGDQPNQAGAGIGVVFWRPAIVCKHVFDRIFEPKIEEANELVERMHSNYVGEFEPGDGQKFKDARNEQELSVREVREKVTEEISDRVPVEFSSKLRRVEDGLDEPESIAEDFSEEHLEALESILDIEIGEDEEDGDEMYSGITESMAKFTGKTDPFYLDHEERQDAIRDFMTEFRFNYYFDYKINLGMHTMK
jgi:hypothetical protein